MPTDEGESLHEFQVEVEEELDIVRASHPQEALDGSPAEWLFDPTDIEREEVGLRSVLAAVESLEDDVRPDADGDK